MIFMDLSAGEEWRGRKEGKSVKAFNMKKLFCLMAEEFFYHIIAVICMIIYAGDKMTAVPMRSSNEESKCLFVVLAKRTNGLP